jgi:hypothetical protein
MADFEFHRDVECVFPMSGQYGRAPRVLYYALVLFVIGFRRQDWLTARAAAVCLTYGGSAAIHALLLAPSLALAKPYVPDGIVTTTTGSEITVKALATDLDTDATLAIVGTGFLNCHSYGSLVGSISSFGSSTYPRPLDNPNICWYDLQHGSLIRRQRFGNGSSTSISILHPWLRRHTPIQWQSYSTY